MEMWEFFCSSYYHLLACISFLIMNFEISSRRSSDVGIEILYSAKLMSRITSFLPRNTPSGQSAVYVFLKLLQYRVSVSIFRPFSDHLVIVGCRSVFPLFFISYIAFYSITKAALRSRLYLISFIVFPSIFFGSRMESLNVICRSVLTFSDFLMLIY